MADQYYDESLGIMITKIPASKRGEKARWAKNYITPRNSWSNMFHSRMKIRQENLEDALINNIDKIKKEEK